MGKLRLPAIILLVVGAVYLLSSAGINLCFRSMRQGHSRSRGSALYFMGTVCISTFRYDRAVRILEVALAKYPNHPSARNGMYNYALCLERLRRRADAMKVYRHYLDKYPNDSRRQKIRNKLDKLEALRTARANFRPAIEKELRS